MIFLSNHPEESYIIFKDQDSRKPKDDADYKGKECEKVRAHQVHYIDEQGGTRVTVIKLLKVTSLPLIFLGPMSLIKSERKANSYNALIPSILLLIRQTCSDSTNAINRGVYLLKERY